MTEQAATVSVVGYEPGHAEIWEKIVAYSRVGTMLHTRQFISYHGDRFADRSLMLEDHCGKTVGVFPAAEDPVNREMVMSHPGLTYGGLVHDGSVRGASMIEATEKIAGHYRQLGYGRLRYKVVPAIYRCRCDLSAAIDLSRRGKVSYRRRRSRAGVALPGRVVATSLRGAPTVLDGKPAS